MMRNVLFVLLFAASVVLAKAQIKTETMQESSKEAQAQSEVAPTPSEEAQPQAEAMPGQVADVQAQTQEKDAKVISGMSILGNQEAPKSLVIVPWKSSEIGNSMNITTKLDDSRQPVDKEVFMRALRYYQIRVEGKP